MPYPNWPEPDVDIDSDISEALKVATTELRKKYDEVVDELKTTEHRVLQLRSNRSYIAKRLKAFGVEVEAAKTKPKKQYDHKTLGLNKPELIARVRDEVAKTDGEFHTTVITSAINSNGETHVGKDAVRNIVRMLHETGELRLVRRGKGGAPLYARVGNGA